MDQAHRHLTTILDLRRVQPGGRLPAAAELAAEIGVSRPAVLQALKILTNEGRVIVRPGRGGTWAATHQPSNLDARIARAWENRDAILEISALRAMVEPGVARLVASRGLSPALAGDARRLIQDMVSASGDGDVELYRALDNEFHLLIAKATGMDTIQAIVTMCREQTAAAFDVMEVPPERRISTDREHEELLAAIIARDPELAEKTMLKHVSTTAALLEAVLGGKVHPLERRARRAIRAMGTT